MYNIRRQLDPDGTLPNVSLDIVGKHSSEFEFPFDYENIDIYESGDKIGDCNLVSERRGSARIAHFDGIEIAERARGRGAGLATYVLAIELSHSRGYNFETQNWELTSYSKQVWERLAQAGIAEVIEPFTPSNKHGKSDRFVGRYRVPILR